MNNAPEETEMYLNGKERVQRKVVEFIIRTYELKEFDVHGKKIDEDWELWGSPMVMEVTRPTKRDGVWEKHQVIAQAFVRYA